MEDILVAIGIVSIRRMMLLLLLLLLLVNTLLLITATVKVNLRDSDSIGIVAAEYESLFTFLCDEMI